MIMLLRKSEARYAKKCEASFHHFNLAAGGLDKIRLFQLENDADSSKAI